MDFDNLKEAYGRLVYTHKTYEKAADMEDYKQRIVLWTNLFLIILSALGIVITGYIANPLVSFASPLITVFTFGFVTYQLTFRPDERARSYRVTARDLRDLRDRYINLLIDIKCKRLSDNQIVDRRDHLGEALAIIYKYALPTNAKAYKKAQKALQIDEEFSFSDNEVDVFLPKNLRG